LGSTGNQQPMSQMMDRIVRSLLDCLFCGNSSWTGSILQFSSYGIANGRGKKSRLHYSRMKFSFKFYLLYLYVSGTRSHLHRQGRNVKPVAPRILHGTPHTIGDSLSWISKSASYFARASITVLNTITMRCGKYIVYAFAG